MCFQARPQAVTRLQASISLLKLKQNNISFGFSRRLVKNQIIKESYYYKNILEICASIHQTIDSEISDENNNQNSLLSESRNKLLDLLEKNLDNSLRSIFNLLSIIYNENDVEMTFVGIQSEIKDARLNSVEFLDNMLRRNIKVKIMPIIEHYVIENNHVDFTDIEINILSEKKYLEKLIKIGSSEIRFLALQIVSESKNKEYLPVLLPIKKYRNQNVKQLASDTYTMLKKL